MYGLVSVTWHSCTSNGSTVDSLLAHYLISPPPGGRNLLSPPRKYWTLSVSELDGSKYTNLDHALKAIVLNLSRIKVIDLLRIKTCYVNGHYFLFSNAKYLVNYWKF